MGHEISQFDIPDRQLLASNVQARVSMGKDIGKAKITHTIFGRAKVRVVREQDKKRRAWLLATLVLVAISASVWKWWAASQQTEQLTAPRLKETIRVTAPEFQPEYIPPSDTPQSAQRKSKTQLQAEIDSLVAGSRGLPKPPPGLKATEPVAAKPATPQPLVANRSQLAPPVINNNAAKNQVHQTLPAKPLAPIQSIAPIGEMPPAAQSAGNGPAAVVPHVETPIEKVPPVLSPIGDNQTTDPINTQP